MGIRGDQIEIGLKLATSRNSNIKEKAWGIDAFIELILNNDARFIKDLNEIAATQKIPFEARLRET